MKIGLYQLNSLLANASTFPPSKGVLPVLAAFSSYNLDVRKMARQSLWDIQKKIINDLQFPEDDQKYLDTLRESALFSAHIYNEIESNKRVTENDVVFFFNILIGTGIKGSFYAWRIWQDRFITRPYLKSQVAFFSDEMNLAFVDQYLGASLSKRREHARFFKRILKKIKSRSAVLGYYAGLFKQNRHPDPFLCNLDQAILNSGSIVNTELMSPDPDVRKSALLSLAMFDPLLDQAFLRHILENDPDSEVKIAALNIIESAIPDTYYDLTQIILRILYEKPANESMAAFKALAPSLRFPPHQLMESVKVNRPDQINAILEEIASFSRITFLFSQDLSQNPSWYMTSGIHLFKAMVKGLIQRQPHALLELLNEAGETSLSRKIRIWMKKESSELHSFVSQALGRLEKAKMASTLSCEKLFIRFEKAQEKELKQGVYSHSIQFKDHFFNQNDFSNAINPTLSFMLDGSFFEDCNLSGTVFTDSSFKRVVFYKVDLRNARFQSCWFDHAVFIESRAQYATFRGCSFKKAVFYQSDFFSSDMKNSIFSESVVSKIKFEQANLSGALFTATKFFEVSFKNSILDQTIFFGITTLNCIGPFYQIAGVRTEYPDLVSGYSSSFNGTIPGFDTPVMEKICHLIFANFTGYGKHQFMTKNRNALLAACDLFSPKTYDLFELIPLMIHEDVSFPGYNAHQHKAPHGICDYLPSTLAKERCRKYLGHVKPLLKRPETYLIEGLFTIGSTGSIAQNASSDIDYWVCIDDKYDIQMKNALEEKLEKLEIWAQDCFRTEIHFFIVEIRQAKFNNFGHANFHGSGTAQAMILKDEFYRTMVLIAGKLPLWAVLPPDICRLHYEKIYTLLFQDPTSCSYIDLGDIQFIPKKEYYGALIWQIFKGIGKAFKSVIKMALVEKYYYGSQDDPLLCNQFKHNWINTQTQIGIYNNDPYYALINTLIDYYTNALDHYSADLIKLCFVAQMSNLNPSDIENTPFGIKNTIVRKIMTQRQWNGDNVFKLGDLRKWDFSNIIKISEIMKNQFLTKYKELSRAMGDDRDETNLISPKDRTILAKKMYVQFSKQPEKIENLLLVVQNDTYFQKLYLRYEKPGGGWELTHRFGRIGNMREEVLKTAECIEQIAAWMINNRLYNENIIIHMEPNMTHVTSDDINQLFTAMNTLFLPYDRDRIKLSRFLSKSRIEFLFICLNFYESRTCKRIEEGVIVYVNSWGEMFCRPFSSDSGFDSIQSLDTYLKKNLDLVELPVNRSYFFPKRFRLLSQG